MPGYGRDPWGPHVKVSAGSRAELDQDSADITEDEDAKDQPGR